MASEAIHKYIVKRYDRWMDHARYFCSLAGIENEAVDILNEVLCMVLEKDSEFIDRLFSVKRGGYCELDFYLLKMIRLNITSPTSPYQHKYKPIPVDDNVDWQRLDIVDEQDEYPDQGKDLLEKYQQVREVFESLHLSKKAQRVFSWKFLEDESFSDWPGPEDKRELYKIYNRVVDMIKDRIGGNSLGL